MPVTVKIDNIPIIFPFEPYDVQRDFMTKMVECLNTGQHGMLESPTGTGKTLSLLCSSLAWLTTKMGSDVGKKVPEKKEDPSDLVGVHTKENQPERLRIIYSSRTHTQLTQAIAELRRTHYAYVNSAVMGSRDQLCIHEEVSKETNNGVKVTKCRAAVKRKSCLYQSNVERTKDDPVYQNEILDIEDLVKVGRKLSNCPYFMSRELKNSADIVFMPYNYLLDMTLRKRMEIKLENCVVILDEGHNVEKICEDSASFELSWTDLSECVEELTEILEAWSRIEKHAAEHPPFSQHEIISLKQVMRGLQTAVDNIPLLNKDSSSRFNGEYIFELLRKSNIDHTNFGIYDNLISRLNEWVTTNESVSLQHIGAGLDRFQNFLQIVFLMDKCTFEEHKKRVAESYKVYVSLESLRKNAPPPTRPKKDDKKIVKRDAKVVYFWCFNPAFGMEALVREGAHSVIITSGTLSPLEPLICELGIPIKVTLECGHVIGKEQVYVGIIETGADKFQLNSSYKTRDDPGYQQSLGRTILNISRLIPHGLLVFFPSYAVMEKCQDAWMSSGVWDSLNKSKEICIEPRNKRELKEVMSRYYSVNALPGSKGAIFMAVCRGKVSEGLDFIDHNGRGVIITGLPFPPCFDPRVEMKKQYLTENKKRLTGFDWYQLEATRAVNQAIGRVIRHKNDYGVILFCDNRFSSLAIRRNLSCWIRNQVKIHGSFPNLPRPLALFFKHAVETLPQPEIKPVKVEDSDQSDDDDYKKSRQSESPSKYGDSPSKYPERHGSFYSRFLASRRYGKNLHQYAEDYHDSKQSWRNRRQYNARGYGNPYDRRNRGEPAPVRFVADTSFASDKSDKSTDGTWTPTSSYASASTVDSPFAPSSVSSTSTAYTSSDGTWVPSSSLASTSTEGMSTDGTRTPASSLASVSTAYTSSDGTWVPSSSLASTSTEGMSTDGTRTPTSSLASVSTAYTSTDGTWVPSSALASSSTEAMSTDGTLTPTSSFASASTADTGVLSSFAVRSTGYTSTDGTWVPPSSFAGTSSADTSIADTSIDDTSDSSVVALSPENVAKTSLAKTACSTSTSYHRPDNNWRKSEDEWMKFKATSGIVSRPGNARGGKVYVPSDSSRNELQAPGRDVALAERPGVSGAFNGLAEAANITSIADNQPAAAAALSPYQSVSDVKYYIMLTENVPGAGSSAAGPSAARPLGAGGASNAVTEIAATSNNRIRISDLQVNPDGVGTLALYVDNQFVSLDQQAEFILGDPQVPQDVIMIDD